MSRRFQLSLRDQRDADLKTVLRLMAGLCAIFATAALAWCVLQAVPAFFPGDDSDDIQAGIEQADIQQAEKEGKAALRKIYGARMPVLPQ